MADIKNLNSQASKLADLINYQDNSIVSKEIIKGKNGSVTVFAFDGGEGLSEHAAPFDALIYAVEGEAEIMISGKNHSLKEGEVIILPANEPHSVKAVKRFKMMLVMIRG